MFRLRYLPSLFTLTAVTLQGSLAYAQAASGPFNLRSYGAAGGNGTNCAADTAGFIAAFGAVPATGGEIYIPAGTYCVTGTLQVIDKPFAIRGEGQNVTILRFDGGSDGIQFISNSTTTHAALSVKSLSIVSNKANGGSAIHGTWATSSIAAGPTATIMDVNINHLLTPSLGWQPWTYGIQLSNGSKALISHVNIQSPSLDSGTAAIRFEGQTIHPSVSLGEILAYGDGVQMVGTGEGLHVSDVEIVGTHRGIVLDNGGAPGPLPGTSIANNHMSVADKGIYIYNHNDVALSNNSIYSTTFSTDFKGVHAINTGDLTITGNRVIRIGVSGSYNGIVIEGTATNSVIANNVTENMDAGIWLTGTGVTGFMVNGNVNRLCHYMCTLDWSTPGQNAFVNNF